MKKLLKTFIDFEWLAYWLIKSDSTAETINSFENVRQKFENQMMSDRIKFEHDAKLIKKLNLIPEAVPVRTNAKDPVFDKPLKEISYGNI